MVWEIESPGSLSVNRKLRCVCPCLESGPSFWSFTPKTLQEVTGGYKHPVSVPWGSSCASPAGRPAALGTRDARVTLRWWSCRPEWRCCPGSGPWRSVWPRLWARCAAESVPGHTAWACRCTVSWQRTLWATSCARCRFSLPSLWAAGRAAALSWRHSILVHHWLGRFRRALCRWSWRGLRRSPRRCRAVWMDTASALPDSIACKGLSFCS